MFLSVIVYATLLFCVSPVQTSIYKLIECFRWFVFVSFDIIDLRATTSIQFYCIQLSK